MIRLENLDDFVSEIDGEIVANIMYTKSKIVRPNGGEISTITFGPVSVKPKLHNSGIGSALIEHSLAKAKELGHRTVVIVGHENYYPRFGFRPASEYGLTLPDGSTFPAFMALEIETGALGTSGGIWHEDEVFDIDEQALEKYNQTFFPSL